MTEVALPVTGALASTMAIDVAPTAARFVVRVGVNHKVAESLVFLSEEVVGSAVVDVSSIMTLLGHTPDFTLATALACSGAHSDPLLLTAVG